MDHNLEPTTGMKICSGKLFRQWSKLFEFSRSPWAYFSMAPSSLLHQWWSSGIGSYVWVRVVGNKNYQIIKMRHKKNCSHKFSILPCSHRRYIKEPEYSVVNSLFNGNYFAMFKFCSTGVFFNMASCFVLDEWWSGYPIPSCWKIRLPKTTSFRA